MNYLHKKVLDVIRIEGQSNKDPGYRFAMSCMGTFEDFKNKHIPFIRREKIAMGSYTYAELIQNGYKHDWIFEQFNRIMKRWYVCEKGKTTPPYFLTSEWIKFQAGTSNKLKLSDKPGGMVTYDHLSNVEMKSDAEIEEIFKASKMKFQNLCIGSCRYKMYHKFMEMLQNFSTQMYKNNSIASPFSHDLEKFSHKSKPVKRTNFCAAITRMMVLVRLAHVAENMGKSNLQKQQLKEQKKIANNKRVMKYNTMKNNMGLENWNQKKAHDQEIKAIKAAEKISLSGTTTRTAKFVKWRTETLEGKKFDSCPLKADITQLACSCGIVKDCKQLGYTSRPILQQLVKRCLDNPVLYSKCSIKFKPDVAIASTQVYQYVPLQGIQPCVLRQTKDVDVKRTFNICGMYKWGIDYYIQPDNKNGKPMGGNIYFTLPTMWKDYEKWTGFGIMGNPQKTTYMETLFKITSTNIEEFTFVMHGKAYRVGYTSNVAVHENVDELLKRVTTAASIASFFAQEEKKHKAQKARKKETERRRDKAKQKLDSSCQETQRNFSFFNGWKRENITAKEKLALKLANDEIDMDTFKKALEALS